MWRVEKVSRLEEKKMKLFAECQVITLGKHISLPSARLCRVFLARLPSVFVCRVFPLTDTWQTYSWTAHGLMNVHVAVLCRVPSFCRVFFSGLPSAKLCRVFFVFFCRVQLFCWVFFIALERVHKVKCANYQCWCQWAMASLCYYMQNSHMYYMLAVCLCLPRNQI